MGDGPSEAGFMIAGARSGCAKEARLRERFTIREERFEHHGIPLNLILPRAADELLDEEAFARDERMPYWAELWPAARGLTRWLLDHPPKRGTTIIELGCGLALPSLALRRAGFEVAATDHNEDALQFVEVNAARNGIDGLRTIPLDWRSPSLPLDRAELVIAADVLYERRNVEMLASVVPRAVLPGGRFLLADPGRRHLETCIHEFSKRGWLDDPRGLVEESQHFATGPATSRIRIHEFRRAAD